MKNKNEKGARSESRSDRAKADKKFPLSQFNKDQRDDAEKALQRQKDSPAVDSPDSKA